MTDFGKKSSFIFSRSHFVDRWFRDPSEQRQPDRVHSPGGRLQAQQTNQNTVQRFQVQREYEN